MKDKKLKYNITTHQSTIKIEKILLKSKALLISFMIIRAVHYFFYILISTYSIPMKTALKVIAKMAVEKETLVGVTIDESLYTKREHVPRIYPA